jgi:hypothetical protein
VHDLDYKLHFGIPETSKKKFWIIQNLHLKNGMKARLTFIQQGIWKSLGLT